MFDLSAILDSIAGAVTTVRVLSIAAIVILAVGIALLVLRGVRRKRTCRALEASADSEKDRIDDFLSSRRVALVGASTDPAHFSRLVMSELLSHGIDVIPIHPGVKSVGGARAYAHVAEVAEFVNGVLIMTPATASAAVVEECGKAGIKRVWLHQGVGPGAVSEEAIRTARRYDMAVVSGRCPLMFLKPHASSIHALHAAWLRLFGRYPRSAAAARRRHPLAK